MSSQKKIISILFIIFNIVNFSKGQNALRESKLLKFDMKDLNYKLEKDKYSEDILIYLGYRGRVVGGINALLNTTQSRIRYEGLRPENTIAYKVDYCVDSLIDVKSYILKTLSKTYKFEISEKEELTETYKLMVIDGSKLVKLTKNENETKSLYEKCGFSSLKMVYDLDSIYRLHKKMCLKCLAEMFEISLNTIVNVDSIDNIEYDFIFPDFMNYKPKFAINPKATFENINQYFGENYGLQLIKEKRLEKFRLVKFYQ